MGGVLEYEEGEYLPAEDIARPIISFSREHTKPPTLIALYDTMETAMSGSSYIMAFLYFDVYQYVGTPLGYGSYKVYGWASYYRTATSINSNAFTQYDYAGNRTGARYFANAEFFRPYGGSDTQYGLAGGRTYKWIAIWAS